jgi:hypothetical protein
MSANTTNKKPCCIENQKGEPAMNATKTSFAVGVIGLCLAAALMTVRLPPPPPPGTPYIDSPEYSMFNHRWAGVFIFLWGGFALAAALQNPQKTWIRFLAPLALLALVEFLFFRNDPDFWPRGRFGFVETMRDPEARQHWMFLVLMLAIAVVELLRAAERLPRVVAAWGVPALAVIGGVLLFFHHHGGPAMAEMHQHMHDPAMAHDPAMMAMMQSMAVVKHEHMWFSIWGFLLAGFKFAADSGKVRSRWPHLVWSLCAMALGVYMAAFYIE